MDSIKTIKKFFKGKKVFITGHTGFKGSWLCSVLLEFGAEPIGYALQPDHEVSLFDIIGMKRKMISYIEDIRNLDSLQSAIAETKPDIVVHMAAQPIVRTGYMDPVGTYTTNVIGTVNLLESCRNVSSILSIVNVTTDKVYENKEWIWGYRENENLCGHDPYSNSKSCSELVTYSYRSSFYAGKHSPVISTARSGNVIGGGDFARDRIVPDCARAALNHDKIILRNPYSIRPYQHVLECLTGYLLLAYRQHENFDLEGSYNFGPFSDDCVDTKSLTEMFCVRWGEGLEYQVESASGPYEANMLMLDSSKAHQLLEWMPRWRIEEAIWKTVEWFKAYRDGNAETETIRQISSYFDICKNENKNRE